MSNFIAPEAAFAEVSDNLQWSAINGQVPLRVSSSFTCPYCNTVAQHHWGTVTALAVFPTSSTTSGRSSQTDGALTLGLCSSCSKETIFLNGQVIVPASSAAPMPVSDLPTDLIEDYMEARAILARSPRGSAALLRLVIQKLLPFLGAIKSDINSAIGELVAMGKIPTALQKALDTVRVVGNEAVHPGLIDLNDTPEVALGLFKLINIVVEKAISEPREVDALYSSLPAGKLEGIERRDKHP